MDFTFDPKTQRYRFVRGAGRGQFASDRQVRELTKTAIAQTKGDIKTIGKLLIDGKISVSTWESETARALKVLHIQMATLGKGGLKRMNQSDYGAVGRELKFQYEKLRGFSEEIIRNGMSVAQFEARLDQYSNAARTSYEQARMRSHKQDGFNWEKRIRTKRESCAPCLSFASLGWQPIGTLPAPTKQCDCMSSCGCYKVYSREIPNDSFQLSKSRYGWISQRLANFY